MVTDERVTRLLWSFGDMIVDLATAMSRALGDTMDGRRVEMSRLGSKSDRFKSNYDIWGVTTISGTLSHCEDVIMSTNHQLELSAL
jgi:hypothetical protein